MMTGYTLTTISWDNRFKHGSTVDQSLVDARKRAIRCWRSEYKAVCVMRAVKTISLDPVGWIEFTDFGFMWKTKKDKKGKVIDPRNGKI